MHSKQFIKKIKSSLFLILLTAIGIVIFIIINNDSKISKKEKHSSDVYSSEKVNKTTNESEDKSKSTQDTSTLTNEYFRKDIIDKKSNPIKSEFGNGGIGEIKNSNPEKLIEYGNDQFGMNIVLPEGWVKGENFGKDHFLIISPKNEQSNQNTIIDVKVIKTETTAKGYAEDIHKNPGYSSVIGGNEELWNEFTASKVKGVNILSPNHKFDCYSVDTYSQNNGCRAFFIVERNGYIITFMSTFEKDFADVVHNDIVTILENTNWLI